MVDEKDAPRTLTREEMYELVWSKPMLEVAKDFGISDVALAKRCKRLSIPVPGRGHWARVEAGQKPSRPDLPTREVDEADQYFDRVALTMPARHDDAPEMEMHDAIRGFESVGALRARVAALSIVPAASVVNCVAAVKRTARHLKHPRRAEFVFERGENTGPLVSMDVSDGALDRACLLADRILKASEILDWQFIAALRNEPGPQPQRLRRRQLDTPRPSTHEPHIGELLVGLHIEERAREEKREPTAAELARERREYRYRAPRKTLVPTGNLRVKCLDTYCAYGGPTRVTWYDRGSTRVEDQLPAILESFYELALSLKARRAEGERKQREYEDAERRRKELEARREANAKLVSPT